MFPKHYSVGNSYSHCPPTTCLFPSHLPPHLPPESTKLFTLMFFVYDTKQQHIYHISVLTMFLDVIPSAHCSLNILSTHNWPWPHLSHCNMGSFKTTVRDSNLCSLKLTKFLLSVLENCWQPRSTKFFAQSFINDIQKLYHLKL